MTQISARNVAGNVSDLVDSFTHRLQAVGASLSAGWLIPTGKTPINGDVGPGRRFSWVDMPLSDVKLIKSGDEVDAKSILGILLLAAAQGIELRRPLTSRRGMR